MGGVGGGYGRVRYSVALPAQSRGAPGRSQGESGVDVYEGSTIRSVEADFEAALTILAHGSCGVAILGAGGDGCGACRL